MNLNTATDEALDHFAELLLKKIDGSFSSDERSYHEKTYGLVEAEMEKRWMSKKKSYETAGESNPSPPWNGPLPDHALDDFRKRLAAKDVEIDHLLAKLKRREVAFHDFRANSNSEIERLRQELVAVPAKIEAQYQALTRIRTLRLPLDCNAARLTNTLADQVPNLDAVLPERTCVCGHAESDHADAYENRPRACNPPPGERHPGCDCTDFKTPEQAEIDRLNRLVEVRGEVFENKDGSTHVELPPGLFHTKKETP